MSPKEMCQSGAQEKPGAGLAGLNDAALARLVANGDREAAAEFVRRNEGLIRARHRWRLRRQPERLADTDDLLSTVTRRVDRVVATGRLLATGPGRLFEFVNRVAERASLEIVRRSRRSYRKHLQADAPAGRTSQVELEHSARSLFESAGLSERDQLIVRLRMNGTSHRQIASHVGITEGLARERYRLAVRKLSRKVQFAEGER